MFSLGSRTALHISRSNKVCKSVRFCMRILHFSRAKIYEKKWIEYYGFEYGFKIWMSLIPSCWGFIVQINWEKMKILSYYYFWTIHLRQNSTLGTSMFVKFTRIFKWSLLLRFSKIKWRKVFNWICRITYWNSASFKRKHLARQRIFYAKLGFGDHFSPFPK